MATERPPHPMVWFIVTLGMVIVVGLLWGVAAVAFPADWTDLLQVGLFGAARHPERQLLARTPTVRGLP